MEQRVLIKISDEEYFASPELNASAIKKLLLSPKHYKYSLEHPSLEKSPALEFGSMVHLAVLEPEEFEKKYEPINLEGIDKRTKAYKELVEKASEAGKEICSTEITSISQAILTNPIVDALLKNSIKEHAIFWDGFKAKIDAYNPDTNTLIDLKTTENIAPEAFIRAVINYGYHVQMAHYMEGVESAGLPVDKVMIIAVEKKAPYDVAVYQLTPELLYYGVAERKRLLSELSVAESFNNWVGITGDEIVQLDLPRWLNKD